MSWKDWATENGEFVGSKKAFSQRLSDLGLASRHIERGTVFRGRRLRF